MRIRVKQNSGIQSARDFIVFQAGDCTDRCVQQVRHGGFCQPVLLAENFEIVGEVEELTI